MGRDNSPARTWIHRVLALVLPFALQAAWLLAYHTYHWNMPDQMGIPVFLVIISSGFVFVVMELRWYAAAVAVFYFPLMFAALAGFSLVFVGTVLGLWL